MDFLTFEKYSFAIYWAGFVLFFFGKFKQKKHKNININIKLIIILNGSRDLLYHWVFTILCFYIIPNKKNQKTKNKTKDTET